MALIIPNISEVSEKLEEYEEELKPTAHGRFLSFKTESFNFWSFRDTNLPCAISKDEDFCRSKTIFEIKHAESRRPSLKDKKSSSLGTAYGRFLYP